MLKKNYSKTGKSCRVTFKLPSEVEAESVHLCGDFNEWSPTENPMKQLKDGSYSITLSLEPGQSYRFRYLLDGKRWENDWDADAYVANQYGSEDSLITV
ncbi:isoamylase early set domain-containing protein [Candidatus Leptofilum sp.]|uniref:isoamylase early set domain-containing protein n=1 Tax=Candidatus Leptofilum sp. TaxID=3241576 RepID=UPI003B5B5BCC